MKRLVAESMSSAEISSLQDQHYALDTQLRALTVKMTPDQKRALIEEAQEIISGTEEN